MEKGTTVAHTYTSTGDALQKALDGLPAYQRAEVYEGLANGEGYARGRKDAIQDHGLPPTFDIEPTVFGRLVALHYCDLYHRRIKVQRDVRDLWGAYVLGEL